MTPRLSFSTLLAVLAASVALPLAAGAQSSPVPAPPVAPSALPAASASPPAATAAPQAAASGDADPFIWLEDVYAKRSLDWVKEENAKSLGVLEQDPHYASLYADALGLAQAKDRIASPEMLAGRIFNFWQDADHVRGIWRETTAADYASATPHWTTVLDLDALSRAEKANWVWEGADCREPEEQVCIVRLSDGGEDAVTLREFNIAARRFVYGGFTFSKGKQDQAWGLDGSLLLARAWKPGQLTTSGYPYVVKRVKRGQSPAQAVEVFRGKPSDVGANPYTLQDGSGNGVSLIRRDVSFFQSEQYLLGPHGAQKIAIPMQSSINGLVAGRLIVKLDEDWKTGSASFGKGSVVSLDLAALEADPAHPRPSLVVAPGPRDSIENESPTKSALIIESLHNVRGRAFVYAPSGTGWTHKPLSLPDNSTVQVVTTSSHSDKAYVSVTNFLVPSTLWSADVATDAVAVVKRTPERFDASKDVVEQFEAISKDGTRVPYFIVHPAGMKADGSNPTVIDAYGGFLISSTPSYSATVGKLWLERGGVYVVANIRGGGEFGPAWHDAGLKTHRQRIYDDFYAVAQDLIAKKITSTQKLGIMGGSNGGLLMGVEMTQHPDEYKAVDIEVPLLDMLRFEQIAAGASWVGEYGSVKVPAERAFLASISPYNQLKPGVTYPEAFIWTTTKDDRVGPQHARKFAAKLASFGDPYLYYEVIEGGHGAGANLKERAHTSALEWTYFSQKLGS